MSPFWSTTKCIWTKESPRKAANPLTMNRVITEEWLFYKTPRLTCFLECMISNVLIDLICCACYNYLDLAPFQSQKASLECKLYLHSQVRMCSYDDTHFHIMVRCNCKMASCSTLSVSAITSPLCPCQTKAPTQNCRKTKDELYSTWNGAD